MSIKKMSEKLDIVDMYETAVNKVLREYLADRLAEEIASRISLEMMKNSQDLQDAMK